MNSVLLDTSFFIRLLNDWAKNTAFLAVSQNRCTSFFF